MDHFPIPKRAHHIRVPYLKSEEYTHGEGGFLGYPARRGWSQKDLMEHNFFGGRSAENVQAFFQTWLYFGCAIEVLKVADVDSSTEDFLDDEKLFISTKKLPSKIRQWKKQVKKAEDEGRQKRVKSWKEEVEMILLESYKFLDHYCGADRLDTKPSATTWPVSKEISMSLIALGYTLGEMTVSINKRNDWPPSALLRDRMLKNGWCPMDVQRSLTDMGIDGHYYISASSNVHGQLSHAKCTKNQCLGTSIDEKTYITKHTEDCDHYENCKGSLVEIDVKLVVEILEKGGFPVVSWSASDYKLEVKEFNESKGIQPTYVSVSHVWSDGMGNPTQNALPACQLSRLQRVVDDLADHVKSSDCSLHFWMDTLCVPVASDLKPYWNLSIRHMADIYKSASAVLVIESELMKLPSDASEYDISLCIYFNKWNHRLWTFQEGMLAKSLMLQFADKAISYRDELNFFDRKEQSVSQGHCVSFPNRACSSTMGEFVILHDLLGMDFGIDQALAPMVSAIQHRNTTKLADQTLCACTIMGRDPVKLLQAPVNADDELQDQRMKIFLEMLGKFPPVSSSTHVLGCSVKGSAGLRGHF